ncbi:hypothetical protein O3672_02035 [Streptococcus chosunense]|nr:MAG TPA: hypothetical protein [Caudoviricetes sp.]
MNNLENLATEIGKDIKDIRTRFATKEEMHEATEIDYSQIVTHEELEGKHYLTQHQSLADYAKKSEIVKPQLTLTGNDLSITGGNRVTLPLPENVGHEIRGTGSPEGRVVAGIGTTYVDVNKTNGALKWIKESGNGNTGWKVLIGDTGWITLNSASILTNGSQKSFIKIRRVNNLVSYNFGGLQYGWFGIIRRNGPGFVGHGSTGTRGVKVVTPGNIPQGFRSESSLIGGIYSDSGKPYGIWYLGGKSDSNFIQFTFNEEIPTNKDIGDIRVSAVSYITDEDWPTTLP